MAGSTNCNAAVYNISKSVDSVDRPLCGAAHYTDTRAMLSLATKQVNKIDKFVFEICAKQLTILTTDQHEDGGTFAPLQGMRVLDLSRVLAGPYCTMLLGDLGAEVIKVEKPGVGDDTRSWGPPWVGKESAYHLSVNRNKKSICVDMKKKEGANIIKQLASHSDVLVENYLPNKLSELGLGYEHLKLVNKELIYVSITGFGPTGPYSQRGGYDNIVNAIGGLMHITGPQNGEPCRTGVALTDLQTGLYAKSAILTALLQRQKSKKGMHININLLNTQIAILTHIASNWLNCKVDAVRMGTSHPSLVPYQAFKTNGDNEYIIIGAGNNKQFEELCKRLGLEELVSDDRFSSNGNRVVNRQALVDKLNRKFSEKTCSEWMKVFEGVAFPYGPINNIQQAFSDPQVIHNKMIQEMEHPTYGHIRLAGPAVTYSEGPTRLQCPPPTLGQHTTEILNQVLNYDPVMIETLKRDEIVR